MFLVTTSIDLNKKKTSGQLLLGKQILEATKMKALPIDIRRRQWCSEPDSCKKMTCLSPLSQLGFIIVFGVHLIDGSTI